MTHGSFLGGKESFLHYQNWFILLTSDCFQQQLVLVNLTNVQAGLAGVSLLQIRLDSLAKHIKNLIYLLKPST